MAAYILLLFLAQTAFSQEQSIDTAATAENVAAPAAVNGFGSRSLGHNLSTNNNTLGQRETSIGTLFVAHGITDQLSIGSSVFVLAEYEMFNAMARYAFPISDKEKIGFDVAYFKTFGGNARTSETCFDTGSGIECSLSATYYDGFIMEAINGKFTYTNLITNYYRFNTTLSYFYYFDDRMPFSFRMDPANNDPFTLNLTSLHEFKVNKHFFVNLEGGLWGLNYNYPYYHTGITLNLQARNVLVGAGVSTTFSPAFPRERARSFAGYDSRYSIHPEVQLQFFF